MHICILMYVKYDKPIVGRDPMWRPLPHWRAELARRQGRGAGQGWAHSLRSPAHVASMLIIHVTNIYYICSLSGH